MSPVDRWRRPAPPITRGATPPPEPTDIPDDQEQDEDREVREVVQVREVEGTINGLQVTMRLRFTEDEYWQLQDITDPSEALAFIQERRDRIDMVYAETKTEVHQQVCSHYKAQGRFAGVRYRLEPPRGTRPQVSPEDLKSMFAQHALILIGMQEGYGFESADDGWDEPYAFGFNRYGWNADDAYEQIQFRLQTTEDADLQVEFDHDSKLFHPELIDAQRASDEQAAANRESFFAEQVAECADTMSIESLRIADGRGRTIIQNALETAASQYGLTISDPAFIERFLASYDASVLQQAIRDQEATRRWYDQGLSTRELSQRAKDHTGRVAATKLAADIVAAYKLEASEGGELVEVREALRLKVQQLIAAIDKVDQDSSPAAIAGLISRLNTEFDTPVGAQYGTARGVSKEKAMRSGHFNTITRYLGQVDPNFPVTVANRLSWGAAELKKKLDKNVNGLVQGRVLSAIKGRFDEAMVSRVTGKWTPADRLIEREAQQQGKVRDQRFLRSKATEMRDALPISIMLATQVNQLYQEWQETNDDALLQRMATLIRTEPHLAVDVHISFYFDAGNKNHRYRLLTAVRKIAMNMERFKVGGYIEELRTGPAVEEGQEDADQQKKPASLHSLREMLQSIAA